MDAKMLTRISCRGLLLALLLTLTIGITACQGTQSAFIRTAGNAGAAFAAASLTLRYAHEGRITVAYATSAFENYQSELSNVDQRLVTQANDGQHEVLQRSLLANYRTAMLIIQRPCMIASCRWHVQVALLDQASQAFLKVGDQ